MNRTELNNAILQGTRSILALCATIARPRLEFRTETWTPNIKHDMISSEMEQNLAIRGGQKPEERLRDTGTSSYLQTRMRWSG